MATVLDLITDALRRDMVLAVGQSPSSDDAALGLNVLNQMLDQWKTESLMLYSNTRTTWTIVSGTGTYTVGSGATIAVPRPVYVENCNFVDTSVTPNLEIKMVPLSDDAYAAIPFKTMTSVYPQYYYYNLTIPTATLIIWPAPTSSTLTGAMYSYSQIAEFAATSDTVTVPPAWYRMMSTNLAVELAPYYEREPLPTLVKAAMDSKAAVKRSNIKMLDMSIDPGALIRSGRGGSWLTFYTGP